MGYVWGCMYGWEACRGWGGRFGASGGWVLWVDAVGGWEGRFGAVGGWVLWVVGSW